MADARLGMTGMRAGLHSLTVCEDVALGKLRFGAACKTRIAELAEIAF
jgi:hypothetical protein